jgi:Protein of unknown function (DUF4031)
MVYVGQPQDWGGTDTALRSQNAVWDRWCCMIADTSEELLNMAKQLDLRDDWIKLANTPYEHFDLTISRRRIAISCGVKPITDDEYNEIIAKKVKQDELHR